MLALALALIPLEQLHVSSPPAPEVPAADLTELPHFCEVIADSCSPAERRRPAASLVVVAPAARRPSEEAVASWRALRGLEDAVVLHWGGTCPAAKMGWAAGVLRQVCVPDELEWHPGRALNLAASLASGSLLVIIEPYTWLAPGLLERLLVQQPSAAPAAAAGAPLVVRDAAAGLLAVPRQLLAVAQGWDERASAAHVASGSAASASPRASALTSRPRGAAHAAAPSAALSHSERSRRTRSSCAAATALCTSG